MVTLVLWGVPNAGKTTLFNRLTGQRSSVVNYPGSTVDVAYAPLRDHADVMLVDLPGVVTGVPEDDATDLATTALTHLDAWVPGALGKPSAMVGVVDATQCVHHVALLKPYLDRGYPMIIVLTMMDEAKKKGLRVNVDGLADAIGCPVFPQERYDRPHSGMIVALATVARGSHAPRVSTPITRNELQVAHEWANAQVAACITQASIPPRWDWDRIFLHPVGGFMGFVGGMAMLFSLLLYAAAPFMDMVGALFDGLAQWVGIGVPPGWIRDGLTQGIIPGLASVLVFVPQIFLLFWGIGVLESSGYLARSAVLVDKPLSLIGLNGRSFVPLLSGCACAIPAILATRSIPHKRVRWLTIMAIPLMQCSARLPVYGVLLAALSHQPLVAGVGLTGIYVGSVMIAAVVVALANRYVSPSTSGDFMIQLPSWRMPDWVYLVRHSMRKTREFIKRAGPIIMIISVGLWAASAINVAGQPVMHHVGQWMAPIFAPMGLDWRVGVAVLISFAAREVFVSALAVLVPESVMGIGPSILSPAAIMGLIVFFMVSMQCGATVAVIKHETQSLRFAVALLGGYVSLGYGLAVLMRMVMG